ncbi:DUF4785 domain-containing protein [Legionella sp.]|uniref:DUF4785 domain-containing protein n=1 Tax=Legionella sp. TaxID=459 RepID=UPI003CBBAE01
MKTLYFFLLSIFCVVDANAYTLPQHPTKTYECNECNKLSHENLHANWRMTTLPLGSNISKDYKSYSYNQVITAKQLHQGITLFTRAPGAVVRITPLQKKTIPELELTTPKNQLMSLKDASALYSQDGALEQSFLTAERQTIMQIKPELGFGTFILKSKNIPVSEASNYLIHVFDKFSLIYLHVEPHSLHYQYGEKFTATICLKDNDNSYSLDEVSAALIGTEEQIIPLKLTKIKRNQFEASTTLTSELNSRGDNWYIEAEVISQQKDGLIWRSARTAFSYSIPSASLVDITKIASQPLTFTTTINVATASRYALQTVLFYKNDGGELVPVETSQSSQWLEPGKQTIIFSFDNSQHLEDDRLSVGYLYLTDYGQLKTVYQYNQPIKLSQFMD